MKRSIAIVLILILVQSAGCLGGRTSLDASVWNQTDEGIDIRIVVERSGDGREIFNRTHAIPPYEEESIEPLLTDRGDYRLEVRTPAAAETASFSWSRVEGPDRVVVQVRPDGIEISFDIV